MPFHKILKALIPPGWFATKDCRPLSLIFSEFREVLKANNRVMEIIADMGEKLSGDYLFDLRYVETEVEAMITAMHQAIDAINLLTQNRHRSLYAVFSPMEARVRAILGRRDDREGPALLRLDEIAHRHWPLVGGKAAHLSELLHKSQIRVPEGFVITSRVFHDLLDSNGLREEFAQFELALAKPDNDESRLEALRLHLHDGMLQAAPPSGFLPALDKALHHLSAGCPDPLFLAVRSSAQEEDMDFSFAGQFHSELQVPAETEAVYRAYLQVAASLFAAKAIRYRRQVFPEGSPMSIAACCQRMVPARASGIVYSLDPMDPADGSMVVVGALGQGQAVVEGDVATDFFRIAKDSPLRIIEQVIAKKQQALLPIDGEDGGLSMQEVPAEEAIRPCLDEPTLLELSRIALSLETFLKRPQDIEWTVDRQGILFILQARPLLITESPSDRPRLPERLEGYELIASASGRVAQQGIGAGPVFRVNTLADLENFPDGAVLISRRDSSQYVQVMQRAAAIVTEVGTPTSHMATLCRELRVPCLVGVPDILAQVQDGEEITVDAEDRRIYRGRVAELLTYQASTSMDLYTAPEFRMLRRILREVSRLNLVDPLMQDFRPEECRTFHDLLRFIHETAVLELVELGRNDRCLPGGLARRLDLPVQAGILVIDIGGGLGPDAPADQVPFVAVRSIPFKAILRGMLFPGAWHQEVMPVSFADMMHSMISAPQDTLSGQYTGHNIAIISENYVNLCFRFGYHFNIVDAFCHEVERNNHIYFRFLGGATDLAKRSRRAALIAGILEAFDFSVKTRGDLVIARTGNLIQSEMERTLDILGRLIGFTRQLDVQMTDDRAVARYTEAFLMGDYNVTGR